MSLHLTIKFSNGTNLVIDADETITIGEFKRMLAEKANIPAEQQRLIYSGNVLKDDRTIQSYAIKDGHAVHLVRGASNNIAQQARTNTTPVSTPPTTSNSVPSPWAAPTTNTTNSTTNPFGANPFGTNPFGDFGFGQPNMQQMQQQMMQNPQLMQQMMNSPMVQSLMSNPDSLRSILMANPQTREMLERNPEIGHALSDPAMLRQTMEMARNPELMREMMRSTDRAMSNIESHPEGFNLLRRMYTNVQEPLMEATSAQNSASSSARQEQTSPPPQNPTTAPLANPWGPTPAPSANNANPSTQTPPNPFSFGSLGMGGLGGTGGLGDFSQMMQNPAVQTMMEQMLSNPELMQQAMQSNPMLQQAMGSNPELRNMFSNPEVIRQMANPANMNAIMQMQQAMQQLQSSGLIPPSMGMPTGNSGGFGQPSPFDMNQMMQMMGGMGTQTTTSNEPPEQRYRIELQQLADMGFTNQEQNIQALRSTNGNVQLAVERLLGSL
eukprot:TRINITY_DN14915_c0_g1_i1.p1 TRINITY_DN14915_c0_g1~~TRINITY_DN14915_c0_g1_i1.p1  ORF type:complete len:495 (-),score=109.43 TRINITY_DN14915_c0_g1_i1:61-1545(-)